MLFTHMCTGKGPWHSGTGNPLLLRMVIANEYSRSKSDLTIQADMHADMPQPSTQPIKQLQNMLLGHVTNNMSSKTQTHLLLQ